MPGEDIRAPWCLVDGDSPPPNITVGVDVNITHSKEGIKEERVLREARIFYRLA
jgi:hypothetical protein